MAGCSTAFSSKRRKSSPSCSALVAFDAADSEGCLLAAHFLPALSQTFRRPPCPESCIVARYPDSDTGDEREDWKELARLLYRSNQAWHLAHIIISHLSRRRPTHPDAPHNDLPFDLAHWLQEHTNAPVLSRASQVPSPLSGLNA